VTPKKIRPKGARKALIERMRRRLSSLNREGVYSRRERRHEIARLERGYWERKSRKWSEATFKAGGTIEFKRQMERTKIKMNRLFDQLWKAKTSGQRRELIRRMGGIALPAKTLLKKLPARTRREVIEMRLSIIEELHEKAANTRLPQMERTTAVRVLSARLGKAMPEGLLALLEENPKNHPVAREIERILSIDSGKETIERIKEAMKKNRDPAFRASCLEILSKNGALFSLQALAELFQAPKPIFSGEKQGSKKARARLELLLKQPREKLIKKTAQHITENMSVLQGGKPFDFKQAFFQTGLNAKALLEWYEQFGKIASISGEFNAGLYGDLKAHRDYYARFALNSRGKPNSAYAVKKIEEAMQAIEQYEEHAGRRIEPA